MLIAIFGESCTGKSTLAKGLAQALGADVTSGKDYLRLAKSEQEAERLFRAQLSDAAAGNGNRIDVISEPEQMGFLPEGCIRILMTAELDTIRERFARRTGGKLPPPLGAMLERKHGAFDAQPCTLRFDTTAQTPEAILAAALQAVK